MTLPRYLPAFVLEEIPADEFGVALREPAGADPEYDVLDERGDAIGYLRLAADGAHLSAPYLEAIGAPTEGGTTQFHDEQYPVMTVEPTSAGTSVTVPDRRVAVRLAAGVAVALEQSRSR